MPNNYKIRSTARDPTNLERVHTIIEALGEDVFRKRVEIVEMDTSKLETISEAVKGVSIVIQSAGTTYEVEGLSSDLSHHPTVI